MRGRPSISPGDDSCPQAGAGVAVVGLGNVLMGDDGVGPYAARLLSARWDTGAGVEVWDGGTPGLDLPGRIAGLDALVVLDAVRARGRPGELRRYSGEELLRGPAVQPLSPHEPGLREALLLARAWGAEPRQVWLLGVIPARVATGVRLSRPVRRAVPGLCQSALQVLAGLGHRPHPRKPTRPPDLWWLTPPRHRRP